MKKILLLVLFLFTITLFWPGNVYAKARVITANDLMGRLVLQNDSGNKLWYISPTTKERWYLRNDDDLNLLIETLGVTPTAKEFSQLAKNSKQKTPAALMTKYGGQIIISPESSSTAFFLNKADGVMYGITTFDKFYKAGKIIGVSAGGSVLRQLAMNSVQMTYDPAFYGIAYAKYDGLNILSSNTNSETILPLASLTKLMTALVFLSTDPDWDEEVVITKEEIDYPCTLQTCGTTSEINLKSGDRIKIKDLWVGMLSASSNQSAVILADNSGLSREEFVTKMNEKAESLGLEKTKFTEMSGLSADNISTAEEFARIADAAFDDPRINDATLGNNYVFYVAQADGTTRKVTVSNRNTSLLAMGPIAAKTGYLVEAQRNAAVKKNDLIIVAMHCYSLAQRNSVVKNLMGGVLAVAN